MFQSDMKILSPNHIVTYSPIYHLQLYYCHIFNEARLDLTQENFPAQYWQVRHPSSQERSISQQTGNDD